MAILNLNRSTDQNNPAFSIPSLLAAAAGLGSFMTGAFLGTLLAITAIVLGILGALLALSPRVRGGMISRDRRRLARHHRGGVQARVLMTRA